MALLRLRSTGSCLVTGLLLIVTLNSCRTPQPEVPSPVVAEGSELVHVPSGPFTMGCDSGDLDESPAHQVDLKGFWIGRSLVTNRQYASFLNSHGGGGLLPSEYKPLEGVNTSIRLEGERYVVAPGLEEHPVTGVSWTMARAYCSWAGLRLPSEAEWEKAARGVDRRRYPWGEEWDPKRCNGWRPGQLQVKEELSRVAQMTTDVTAYPGGASPYGCLDMAGNAWEWCSSIYAQYPYLSGDGREDPDKPGPRVIRGGSWCEHPSMLRCSNRYRVFLEFSKADRHFLASTGFRVARSDESNVPATAPATRPIVRRAHPQFQLLAPAPKETPLPPTDEKYRLKTGFHSPSVIMGYPLSRAREVKYFIPLEHLVALSFYNMERCASIVDLLPLKSGQTVADVGAGSGAVTRLLARAVGPTGQIWATDISISALKCMQPQAASEDPGDDLYFFQKDPAWVATPNVRLVLHDVGDCLLPPGSQDLAFLGLVHYFYYPRAQPGVSPPLQQVLRFYRSIGRSLKPGGHLAIYEYTERWKFHDKERGVLKASEIIDQMEQAGFVLTGRHDPPDSVFTMFLFKLKAQASGRVGQRPAHA